MKTKTLAQVDGIIALITGVLLAIMPIIILVLAGIAEDEGVTGIILGIIFFIFTLVKIGILVLGIVSIIYYNEDKRITNAPSLLLIIGAAVGLIPFLGWIGGILIIIGGALFLSSLKKFANSEVF